MTTDREHWNERYAVAAPSFDVSSFVASLDALLPWSGRALDVAGGTGGDALWLAERGLATTLVDVSDVALGSAAGEAAARGVPLDTVALDLEELVLPPGEWDVVVCRNYLQRSLFPVITRSLAPRGTVVIQIATVGNLERHEHPRARFLLGPGEARTLVDGMEIVLDDEAWYNDRHEARLVARRR